MASHPNLCKHIHLPVQSGSTRLLKSMKRGHTRGDFLELVAMLRGIVPEMALTTDLMTGFPGETREDFEETLSLMREVRFDGAFLFRYSPRPGTYAYRRQADDVPDPEKARRLEEMISLQEQISAERYATWIGREVEVLPEGPARRDPTCLRGKSDDFKTVIIPADALPMGALRRVTIARATSHTLIAHGVEPHAGEDLLAELPSVEG
jgi:tRNA-2-methylthio-N6-dimethylallyladenosine synthase